MRGDAGAEEVGEEEEEAEESRRMMRSGGGVGRTSRFSQNWRNPAGPPSSAASFSFALSCSGATPPSWVREYSCWAVESLRAIKERKERGRYDTAAMNEIKENWETTGGEKKRVTSWIQVQHGHVWEGKREGETG